MNLRQLEQVPQGGVVYQSVVLFIFQWDSCDLDIIGLIVIFVFKERFNLKFSFEQKSLKDDQDLLETYLQKLSKF